MFSSVVPNTPKQLQTSTTATPATIASPTTTALRTTNGTDVSKTVIGTSVTLTATGINTLFGTTRNALYGTITITGRDSGARLQVPITITRTS